MKFLGADVYAFYHEWPPGTNWYHDDSDLEIEDERGAPLLDLSAKYDGDELGSICWQGPDPGIVKIGSVTLKGGRGILYEFDPVLSAWLKARQVATLVVEVPHDQVESFTALAATNGWKVRK